jgi:hypothetical protein
MARSWHLAAAAGLSLQPATAALHSAWRCGRVSRTLRHPRGRSLHGSARSHLAGDDRVRTHARARADGHAPQDRCPRPHHGTRLDLYRTRDQFLPADGGLDVAEASVEVGDQNFVAQDASLADDYAGPGRDRAALAEHRALANRHAASVDVQATALAERSAVTHDHACSGCDIEAHSRSEQRPPAQLDPIALTHAHAQRTKAMAKAGARTGGQRAHG